MIGHVTHVLTFAAPAIADDGSAYVAQVFGARRSDGIWEGWLEFVPTSGTSERLRTGRETTQPDERALAYWASGLEPIYLSGAITRARRLAAGHG